MAGRYLVLLGLCLNSFCPESHRSRFLPWFERVRFLSLVSAVLSKSIMSAYDPSNAHCCGI